jgi:hypothetical protein
MVSLAAGDSCVTFTDCNIVGWGNNTSTDIGLPVDNSWNGAAWVRAGPGSQ